MKRRTALIAASVATTLGVVALVLYQERFEERASGGEPVPVLVAAQDLPLGTVLTDDMLGVRDLPESYVEPRHIPAAEADRILGLRVSSAVRANESVLRSDLANSEQRRDLSSLVQDGMRAYTIRADVTSAFAGLLRPGDRVDVLLTVEEGDDAQTAPIAQNVLVLATGRDTGGRLAGARNRRSGDVNQVTLSVTLPQSQTLALGQQRGTISLVLRNPDDIRIIERAPAQTSDALMEAIRSGGITEGN
ncbi:MAG TPA: Flp pilus assembly protein CpaB [Sandaracinaceae bacterium LLY-WYZ-13_1]|nr:Flp pilus assembly protein CpaB [Sandaracinaceae bacterium LLY-WYZ-13_1]